MVLTKKLKIIVLHEYNCVKNKLGTWLCFNIRVFRKNTFSTKKMLESRPEDALVKLVKLVNLVNLVKLVKPWRLGRLRRLQRL